MLSCLSGYLALFGALAATATPVVRDKPPVSVPFARKLSLESGTSIVEMDRARIANLLSSSHPDKQSRSETHQRLSAAATVFNTNATNVLSGYIMTIGVGSPATEYTMIVDTGSSNTWIGANKPYVPTSTSNNTGQTVEVRYGSGGFNGTEYTDTVTLGDGLVITAQSIGVASSAEGIDYDGILGLGPEELTCGSLSPDEEACIPTVLQNAHAQGLIQAEELGIAFAPITDTSGTQANGVVTFGGVDSSLYTGPLTYTNMTDTYPTEYYVGVNQSVSYGSTTLFTNMAGIIDTGTTLIYMPTEAFERYVNATGATFDEAVGLLRITPEQYDQLESMTFTIGGVDYVFTANAQIWPRALNSALGGADGYVYLLAGDIGVSGGFQFVNGMAWLERFYFVYNADERTVAFATTQYTNATTN